MSKYYICDKKNNGKVNCYIDSNKLDGFKIRPKNKVKYDGIEVGKMLLVNPILIERVLKRKTTNQINAYMNFLFNILNDDNDDTDPGDVSLVLEDSIRYKSLVINRYSKYLRNEDIVSIVSKMGFIEDELKEKVSMYEVSYSNNYKGKGR